MHSITKANIITSQPSAITPNRTRRSAVGVDCLDRSRALGSRLPTPLPPALGGASGIYGYGVRDTHDDDVHVRRQRLHARLRGHRLARLPEGRPRGRQGGGRRRGGRRVLTRERDA